MDTYRLPRQSSQDLIEGPPYGHHLASAPTLPHTSQSNLVQGIGVGHKSIVEASSTATDGRKDISRYSEGQHSKEESSLIHRGKTKRIRKPTARKRESIAQEEELLRSRRSSITSGKTVQAVNTPELVDRSQSGPPLSPMSQRNRGPRAGGRSGTQDGGEEVQLWSEIKEILELLAKSEQRAKTFKLQMFELEAKMKADQDGGNKHDLEEYDALSAQFRESLRVCDKSTAILKDQGLMDKVQVLLAMKVHTEETQEASAPRASSSRESKPAVMDLDGTSDSPAPSVAEHKNVRKLGASRTSSLPPAGKDEKEDKETSNSGRTKITFAVGQECAFKPKQTPEHDWIQGIVVKVIGEGKSRRYDVQDPFPDDTSKPGDIHRSSASSMVPIPREGTPLQDYEVGKRVLALYPETTTFYRAEVKANLDSGARVQLLFEDETAGTLKTVERRFVLDHKG